MHVLLQYQSKSYYIIGQEVYYSIGRFITLSGVFYYIIGQLLQYRAFITLSVGTPAMKNCLSVPTLELHRKTEILVQVFKAFHDILCGTCSK